VTLERIVAFLRVVLRRSSYLVLMQENPQIVERLVRLIGASAWIAAELVRQPANLDMLLDPRERVLEPDRAAFEDELAERVAATTGEEALFDALRLFKESHVFKAAVAEVEGTLPLMKVSDWLTWLAEAILETVLRELWREFRDAAGAPHTAPGERLAFVIVGYGKLGGLELSPASDLDLVFVHALPEQAAQFLHRFVRRLLHMLTVPTYFGPLYEVDMRLRPSGNAGTMVSSIDAFERYQGRGAWLWEHQALVRARFVAGDPALGARFEEVRRAVLCSPRDPEEVRGAVLAMRERMARHDAVPHDEALTIAGLKRGSGGIVDIEFMVQYLVLAWAHQNPSLADWPDNVRILESAGRTGVLEPRAAKVLTDAYLAFRARMHRNVLGLAVPEQEEAGLEEQRERVRGIWRELMHPGVNDGVEADG
jgi:glutamate-ammonia-ligase adenylyltransferase